MTETSGGEPAIADVLAAINGLRVNGPEPARALREDVLALGNRTRRLIDGLRGDLEQRSGLLMDAIADLRARLLAHSGAIRDGQDRSSPSHRSARLDRIDLAPAGGRRSRPDRDGRHRSCLRRVAGSPQDDPAASRGRHTPG